MKTWVFLPQEAMNSHPPCVATEVSRGGFLTGSAFVSLPNEVKNKAGVGGWVITAGITAFWLISAAQSDSQPATGSLHRHRGQALSRPSPLVCRAGMCQRGGNPTPQVSTVFF